LNSISFYDIEAEVAAMTYWRAISKLKLLDDFSMPFWDD